MDLKCGFQKLELKSFEIVAIGLILPGRGESRGREGRAIGQKGQNRYSDGGRRMGALCKQLVQTLGKSNLSHPWKPFEWGGEREKMQTMHGIFILCSFTIGNIP